LNGDLRSLDPAVADRKAALVPVMEPSTAMLDALRREIRAEMVTNLRE
jgi:hypothetical protein